MSGSRPAGDTYARNLIEADKRNESEVRKIIDRLPIGDLADTIVALTAYAAASQVAFERHRERRWGHNVTHDPHQPIPVLWTYAEAKRAHAAHYRGHVDPWTKAGERAYQQMRKRAQREAKAGTPRPMEIDGGASHTCRMDHETERRTA